MLLMAVLTPPAVVSTLSKLDKAIHQQPKLRFIRTRAVYEATCEPRPFKPCQRAVIIPQTLSPSEVRSLYLPQKAE